MTLPKVKRYTPSFCVQSEDLSMDETEDGDHVKHEDYEKIETALSRIVGFINLHDDGIVKHFANSIIEELKRNGA